MNWIQGIQSAIDYVEANITEEIDLEEVAKHAYSSSFHFQIEIARTPGSEGAGGLCCLSCLTGYVG